MAQGRLTSQVHKCHPTQPTPEAASQGLESTFVLYIAFRSKISCPLSAACSGLRLDPVSFAQAPLAGTDPMHVPTNSLQHQRFPWGRVPTQARSAPVLWGDSREPGSLQLRRGHSNIFEQLRTEAAVPKLYRKSTLRGAKMFQDTLRSL